MASTATIAAGHWFFWITARAAGTAGGYRRARARQPLGLPGSADRFQARQGRAVELRATHEALSIATPAAIAVHGLSLLGGGGLHPSPGEIAIPFASAHRPLLTSTGIISFWLLALLGLS